MSAPAVVPSSVVDPFPEITRKAPQYWTFIDEWRKIRDTIQGQDEVKNETTRYLPKPKGMDSEQYNRYLDRAVFYGVSERTVRALTGLVFRVPPMADLPRSIESMAKSATPEGFPLETVTRNALREVLSIGRYGVLVDMPQAPRLLGEQVPYLSTYVAERIWRWEELFIPETGIRKLVRVVVEEIPATAKTNTETWLRELFLDENGVYTQQQWVRREAETRSNRTGTSGDSSRDEEFVDRGGFNTFGDPIVPTMNNRPLDTIPFWFINTNNLSPQPHKPPMQDLADMNMAHFRNSADYEQALHLVAQPTPWISADWDEATVPTHIGAGTLWKLSANASVGMLEFSGEGIGALREAMTDKENRMAALGARLIRDQERANVTSETTRLQSKTEESTLLSGVQNVELGVTEALRFAAMWAGSGESEVEDLTYKLNSDFVEIHLTPQELDSLVKGWQSGAYSKTTLHENLQRGEIIPHDRTLDEENDLIEDEAEDMPAGVMGSAMPGTEGAAANGEGTEAGAEAGASTEGDDDSEGAAGGDGAGGSLVTKTTGPGPADGHVHEAATVDGDGVTTVVDDHKHLVVGGVVQEADGHTHTL